MTCTIASATEKQKRVAAQSKLRMQKHLSKTKSILTKDIAKFMELDDVLVNNMKTTLVGAATPLKCKWAYDNLA